MVQARGSATVSTVSRSRPAVGWSWRRWLLLGFCGGIAFGITHRLLSLQFNVPWRNTQPFGVKATPGTGLESLRQRFGGEGKALRGNLEQIELEQQRQRQQQEEAKRLQSLEQQDRLDRERQQRELDQAGQTPLPELPAEPPSPAPEPPPYEPTPLPPLPDPTPLPSPAPRQP
ncbi:MAG: hypothetical protein ACK550_04880 [Synechococcaceae cyanobacterium]